MQVESYQVVYSTLAGDLYDKVIVPRNEGTTTKTSLTGEHGEVSLSFQYNRSASDVSWRIWALVFYMAANNWLTGILIVSI